MTLLPFRRKSKPVASVTPLPLRPTPNRLRCLVCGADIAPGDAGLCRACACGDAL